MNLSRRLVFLALVALLPSCRLFLQGSGLTPVVRYRIRAELLPETGRVVGAETLVWTNSSPVAVDELRFHLYYNAFRNERSTFMTESGVRWRSPEQRKELRFGEIRITEMRVAGGEELTDKLLYMAPDDGNGEDRTVMAVRLANRVEPGASVALEIRFTLQVPRFSPAPEARRNITFSDNGSPKSGSCSPMEAGIAISITPIRSSFPISAITRSA